MSLPLLKASLSPGQIRHKLTFVDATVSAPDGGSIEGFWLRTGPYSEEVEHLASIDGELLSKFPILRGVADSAMFVSAMNLPGGYTGMCYPIGRITWSMPPS